MDTTPDDEESNRHQLTARKALLVVLLFAVLVAEPVMAFGMTQEPNFNTEFGETDPGGYLSVSSSTINGDGVPEDVNAEVVSDDYQPGLGDAIANWSFVITDHTVPSGGVNTYISPSTEFLAPNGRVSASVRLGDNANVFRVDTGTSQSATTGLGSGLNISERYYMHLRMNSSSGVATFELYDDASHTTLIDTETHTYNTSAVFDTFNAVEQSDITGNNFTATYEYTDYELYAEGAMPTNSSLEGRVTDQSGDGIEGATVQTDPDNSTTTNATGWYSFAIHPGTYDVTAFADGYANQTKTVTVSDDETVRQDFSIIEDEKALQIDTRMFLKHGESTPYKIIHGFTDANGNFVREDVTDNATLTSGNTSVVTVDTSTFELNATDDVTVNNRTFVTANYTRDDGEVLTQTQNVTVANKTIDNLDILPPVTRFGASISDRTVQVIILATAVGVAAAIFAGVFAGVAGLTMAMLMGWVIGFVGDGMIIITLITAMFIGMNVAGNVDYTVRR